MNSIKLLVLKQRWIRAWYALGCFTVLMASVPANSYAQDQQYRQTAPPRVTGDELDLSAHDPIYVIVGGSDDIKSRFQISFKYRILRPSYDTLENPMGFQGFYFGYTQRALWNIEEDSAPFEDVNYNPSFFVDFALPKSRLLPDYIRTGYEHESNGQGDELSRSVDSYYVWPFWAGTIAGREWMIAPKFWADIATGSHNEDIDDYRGNTELLLRYGSEDSWLVSTSLRYAEKDRSTITMDISYPLRTSLLERTGAYLYIQVFDGYGESLLTYNMKRDTQARVGIGFVR